MSLSSRNRNGSQANRAGSATTTALQLLFLATTATAQYDFGPSSQTFGDNDDSFGNGGGLDSILGFDVQKASRVRAIHGICAAVAFVGLFPVGSILLRVIPGKAAFYLHVLCQILAFFLYVAAAAMGIWMVKTVTMRDGSSLLELSSYNSHPIIGLVILVLLFIQPILGYIHHAQFKKIGRRTFWSHSHLLIGRSVITLGLVNGGLGLWMAGASREAILAYSVVAALVWIIWVGVAFWHECTRSRRAAANARRQRRRGSSRGTEEGRSRAAKRGQRSHHSVSSSRYGPTPPLTAYPTQLRGGGGSEPGYARNSRWSDETHTHDMATMANEPSPVSPTSNNKTYRSSGGSAERPETATTTSSWGNRAYEFQELRAPPNQQAPHLPPLDTRGTTRVSGVSGVRY